MVGTWGSFTVIDLRKRRVATLVAVVGSAAALLAACSNSAGGSTNSNPPAQQPSQSVAQAASPSSSTSAVSQPETEKVTLIGKIDADSGAPGTFTGKDDWPALAPSDIHVKAGAKVTLTIKEYDDMVTPLPKGSTYNTVAGGTETVNGKPVTVVGNKQIAHTITIPGLGINIPLAKAPEHGYTTITFTFTAPAAGSYHWQCMTPCGGGPHGTGGAMQTSGWMRGELVVA